MNTSEIAERKSCLIHMQFYTREVISTSNEFHRKRITNIFISCFSIFCKTNIRKKKELILKTVYLNFETPLNCCENGLLFMKQRSECGYLRNFSKPEE